MEPSESWVARWQRIGGSSLSIRALADRLLCHQPRSVPFCQSSNSSLVVLFHRRRVDKRMRGIYAVRVTGRPPADVIDTIEARGGVYRARDAVEN